MEHVDDKAPSEAAPIAAPVPAARLAVALAGGAPCESLSALSSRLSDEALMALVLVDDPHAFALLYRRHVRSAAALATNMCSRRVIAEEVVQEAFLSVWRSRRHFDSSRGSVRGWLLGIVRNRAIDVLRQSVAHDLADTGDRAAEDLLEARECTDGEVGRREQARELLSAIEGLPPEQSRVIALAYYGGYTHVEIATMLDTPIGTVKGRMRLGLRKMAVSVPFAI
jgi:RNA polymerase sigma-70 factor (ECF subfamily)